MAQGASSRVAGRRPDADAVPQRGGGAARRGVVMARRRRGAAW
ncbi:hypothetical protein [Streptomyces sp. yr375]|nr:hypothetical protein [Streptomyces sp. yr375]